MARGVISEIVREPHPRFIPETSCPRFIPKENNMRIICDHCDRPILGTVRVLAGTFNLHPDCLTDLGKETNHKSTAISWQGPDSSVSVDLNTATPNV